MPGARGFWCVSLDGVTEFPDRTHCFRSEKVCRQQRKRGADGGFELSECTKTEQAACFDIRDHEHQATYYRCTGTHEECTALRDVEISQHPKLTFGACLTTARADTGTRAAPPAPRAPPAA